MVRVRVVRSLTCSCAEEDHRNCQEVAQVHGHAATEPNFSEWGGNNGKSDVNTKSHEVIQYGRLLRNKGNTTTTHR